MLGGIHPVAVHSRIGPRDVQLSAWAVMSPAVRHADYAALDMWRQLDGYDYATFAARHRNMVPVVNIQCRGIVWLRIGRASCRERVCQSVSISVVAVSLHKKKQK